MNRKVKNDKEFLEYIDRTSKKEIVLHSETSDIEGNKDFWARWSNEIHIREEVSCYELGDLLSDDGYVGSEERTVYELLN